MRLRTFARCFCTLKYQIRCKVWKRKLQLLIVLVLGHWMMHKLKAAGSNEKDSSRDDLSQKRDVSDSCLREAIMKIEKAKSAIADLTFHTRSTSNRVKHILQKQNDIGQRMDRIAKEAGLGADRWGRTGVTVLEHGGEKAEKKMFL